MNVDLWARLKFQLWSVSVEPPRNTPVVEYGKENEKRFTIRVVHGGFFTDYQMLGCFSRSLGYISLGNWYHMPTEEHSGLSMIPIMNDECLGPFMTLVRAQKFREIEHLYVEHMPVFVPNNFPHFLMNSPAKRVEKLIHMFVTDHPMASVDDGIAYINHMLNMRIPREKMEDAMDMAKENVIAWKDIS
ncbi:unnamed protein product [Lactuca saligna]|uniref:Uncharacterized protein n=1 Tax=Lactuca saligna TaxID=75948 RepID=A0AA35VGU9_LACSI|nr:unnamed protein product [Lactuca saligna]